MSAVVTTSALRRRRGDGGSFGWEAEGGKPSPLPNAGAAWTTSSASSSTRPRKAAGAGGHAYVLLNRLRAQVERSLGALLVARYGRADCQELARLLAGWDGRFSPLVRKRVARHADHRETCADRRRTMASPLAVTARWWRAATAW